MGVALAMALLWSAGVIDAVGQERGYDCIVDPAVVVRLGSPTAGILEKILVDRGDTVKKGQKVAQLNDAVETATVAINQSVAASDADIAAAKTRADLAQKELDRSLGIKNQDFVAQQKIDQLRASLAVAKMDMKRTAYAQERARLELERSKAMLDQRSIRSLIDGVVVKRERGPGEYIYQEAPILTVAQVNPLYVETFIPVDEFASVQLGDAATVHPLQPAGQTFEAKVIVVDTIFNTASGTFGVRLKLDNPKGKIPAGQRCIVKFGGK